MHILGFGHMTETSDGSLAALLLAASEPDSAELSAPVELEAAAEPEAAAELEAAGRV